MDRDRHGEHGVDPHRRVRVRRRRTIGERLAKSLAMPHLTRWERAERLAIVLIFVLVAIYLLASPFVRTFFPDAPKAPATISQPPAKKVLLPE